MFMSSIFISDASWPDSSHMGSKVVSQKVNFLFTVAPDMSNLMEYIIWQLSPGTISLPPWLWAIKTLVWKPLDINSIVMQESKITYVKQFHPAMKYIEVFCFVPQKNLISFFFGCPSSMVKVEGSVGNIETSWGQDGSPVYRMVGHMLSCPDPDFSPFYCRLPPSSPPWSPSYHPYPRLSPPTHPPIHAFSHPYLGFVPVQYYDSELSI